MKKLLLILAVLPILWFTIAAFMPSTVLITRSEQIFAPADSVFGQFNNLKNWKKWSYWEKADPKMVSTYGGPAIGVGSNHSWKSEKMGNGTLTIVESTPPTGIKYELQFEGMDPAQGAISLMGRGNELLVTMQLEMQLPLWGRPMGPIMDRMMGPDFEAGLKGMKSISENNH